MANTCFSYSIPDGKNVSGLISAVDTCLTKEKMTTQKLTDELGNKVLQARASGGKWKQFLGMDKAITIRFKESKESVSVEIGDAKWVDKGAVMVTSLFVLWPLALTSGYGLYKQGKLPDMIRGAATAYIGEEPEFPEKNPGTLDKLAEAVESADKKLAQNHTVQKLVAESSKIISQFFR